MIFFICASCSANGFQSARKSSSFCEDEIEDGLSEQGQFGLWSNTLIMLHQTVSLCVFSNAVFINISFWSYVEKTFKIRFKFLSEYVHPEHICSRKMWENGPEGTILSLYSMLHIQRLWRWYCWDLMLKLSSRPLNQFNVYNNSIRTLVPRFKPFVATICILIWQCCSAHVMLWNKCEKAWDKTVRELQHTKRNIQNSHMAKC